MQRTPSICRNLAPSIDNLRLLKYSVPAFKLLRYSMVDHMFGRTQVSFVTD